MRIDNLGAIQAGREFDQKQRPEIRERKAPEPPEKPMTSQRSVRYQKHASTNRWMIKVLDVHSKEIIREIPDRKRLDMAAAMKDYLGQVQVSGKIKDSRC